MEIHNPAAVARYSKNAGAAFRLRYPALSTASPASTASDEVFFVPIANLN